MIEWNKSGHRSGLFSVLVCLRFLPAFHVTDVLGMERLRFRKFHTLKIVRPKQRMHLEGSRVRPSPSRFGGPGVFTSILAKLARERRWRDSVGLSVRELRSVRKAVRRRAETSMWSFCFFFFARSGSGGMWMQCLQR